MKKGNRPWMHTVALLVACVMSIAACGSGVPTVASPGAPAAEESGRDTIVVEPGPDDHSTGEPDGDAIIGADDPAGRSAESAVRAPTSTIATTEPDDRTGEPAVVDPSDTTPPAATAGSKPDDDGRASSTSSGGSEPRRSQPPDDDDDPSTDGSAGSTPVVVVSVPDAPPDDAGDDPPGETPSTTVPGGPTSTVGNGPTTTSGGATTTTTSAAGSSGTTSSTTDGGSTSSTTSGGGTTSTTGGDVDTTTTTSARESVEELEREFVIALNDRRGEEGLAPFDLHDGMNRAARAWSLDMARRAKLEHAPDITDGLPPTWQLAAENVGVGNSVDDLMEAFMDSREHRVNILNPAYRALGIGVIVTDSGRIYVTQRFAKLST